MEAIRALMVAKRTARSERTQTINQARSLVLTGPDDLRVRFIHHTTTGLVAELAALRPRPGDIVGYATRIALRELGRRAEFPGRPARAPGRADRPAGDRPRARPARLVWRRPRYRGPAAGCRGGPPRAAALRSRLAHLCAVAPIPASSGRITRHRLNPGGDRQANHALWRIVITRMSSHPPTRAYAGRRSKEGLPEKEIIRCLTRYVAREACSCLRPPAG